MPGIGPKRAAALAAKGLRTAGDALFHLPARYQDWRELKALHELQPDTVATVEGELGPLSARPMPGSPWRTLASGFISAGRGARLRVIWFNLPAHMRANLPQRQRVLAHGRVASAPDGTLEMVHPELHRLHDGPPPGLRPVYSLPPQVGQRLFARMIARLLDSLADQIEGAVPAAMWRATGLPPLAEALRLIHAPESDCDAAALASGGTPAHQALALDEMFAFQLALGTERERAGRRPAIAFAGPPALSATFLGQLPFALTRSQRGAIEEIGGGMERARQMNRILIGDVGSGKTVVALWAALRAVESGYQAAIMTPTELLAEQHYQTFVRLCPGLGVQAGLLSGKVAGASRSALVAALARGELALVFGTHALIQREIRFHHLGLAIIDEQHRFGVLDRARLKALGPRADMLLMTATPIPRSLALTLLANLEVCWLDEMPPGRTPVATEVCTERDADRIEGAVRTQLLAGRRAYYVLPQIEGEDKEAPSVEAMAQRLARGALRAFRIGTLHGRMRAADKERVMRAFRDGALDLLVATTLIEVGIDVPQATVMVVSAAERFGLAQLHQLRGRVGRGEHPSRCYLVMSRPDSPARARLAVMAKYASGAEIAQADLELRGPGDLFGSRQTGPLPLCFARFIQDLKLIELARALAERTLRGDPQLKSAPAARAAMRSMLELGFSLGDVG